MNDKENRFDQYEKRYQKINDEFFDLVYDILGLPDQKQTNFLLDLLIDQQILLYEGISNGSNEELYVKLSNRLKDSK